MSRRLRLSVLGLSLFATFGSTSLAGQSLTSGALRGAVQDLGGGALSGVAVTIEGRDGQSVGNLESADDGSFALTLLLPGTYAILFEAPGYQPVRQRGVLVSAGRTTILTVQLERRPPPIASVTEIGGAGASAGALGRIVVTQSFAGFEPGRSVSELSRGLSEVVRPTSGGRGFALAAGGLAAGHQRIFVDGIPELFLRHPGLRSEPAEVPAFATGGSVEAQLLGAASNAEWPGVAGSLLAVQTRSGGGRTRFAPFATFGGAKLGGNSVENPGDSSATSFQVGAIVTGTLKPDTAFFALGGAYQSLESPSAFPWEADSTRYDGQIATLRDALPRIGIDSFGTSLARAVAPVVRTWKGGHAFGRLDWQISGKTNLMSRLAFASWKESNPVLGAGAWNNAGTKLDGRDLSVLVALTSVGKTISNEARIGLASSKRDWSTDAGPGTLLAGEGIGFGALGTPNASFEVSSLNFVDAIHHPAGRHGIKAGMTVDLTRYRYDYRYGSQGIFLFGNLDRLGAANGAFAQAEAAGEAPSFSFKTIGLFVQDTWSLSPDFQLHLGLRWETQILPIDKLSSILDWSEFTGVADSIQLKDRRGFQPRVGFLWTGGRRKEWLLQGSVGLYSSGMDPMAFAEAVTHTGSVTVRRAIGQFDQWPALPSAAQTPERHHALTQILGGSSYRAPRTLKGEAGISRDFGGGTSFGLTASHYHSDFLLRRIDRNRAAAPSGETQEGRPVFGVLVQQGGLVTALPTSSRRFRNFDLVSGLVPTGFSDHYEVTAALDRRISRGFSLMASYTYSRTRDNLVGLLQADPADQLSPFPEGLDGQDWDEARSDLDIPHRVAATAEFSGGTNGRLALAARARWRSGLPFTPGFRSGVDMNGDLGGNNDPASADVVGTPGDMATCDGASVGRFAARNSCREKGVASLDLRLSFGLRRLTITVDAFNVVSTRAGLVDRAVLLVDPEQTLQTTPEGAVTVPLMLNPRFGTLLSRRSEPRFVRFGLRVEY
ncbi:MAG: TonB-dependent receptor [Gemmatimonadales bacterium]|nr:TonB-dependent receptor [Gemmatimonadales bacterium]